MPSATDLFYVRIRLAFPHTTNLQQMILKAISQKHDNSLQMKQQPLDKVENIIAK